MVDDNGVLSLSRHVSQKTKGSSMWEIPSKKICYREKVKVLRHKSLEDESFPFGKVTFEGRYVRLQVGKSKNLIYIPTFGASAWSGDIAVPYLEIPSNQPPITCLKSKKKRKHIYQAVSSQIKIREYQYQYQSEHSQLKLQILDIEINDNQTYCNYTPEN